jgi:PAS domain S-box-containing protein
VLVHTDGSRHHVQVLRKALKDETGHPQSVIITAVDVSAIKEAEARLQDQVLFAEQLVEKMPVALTVSDLESRVTRTNEAFTTLSGYLPEELLNKTPWEVMPDEDKGLGIRARMEDVELLAARDEPVVRESVMRHKTQPARAVIVVKSVYHDARGQPVGILKAYVDIEDQKRLQRDLEKSREEALEAVKAKAAFLATMSHEIRTPMNGVIGMTALLAETPLNNEQRDYVDTVRTSGDALLTIINDILDFSKIESGKMDFESEPLSLARAIEESFDILAPA